MVSTLREKRWSCWERLQEEQTPNFQAPTVDFNTRPSKHSFPRFLAAIWSQISCTMCAETTRCSGIFLPAFLASLDLGSLSFWSPNQVSVFLEPWTCPYTSLFDNAVALILLDSLSYNQDGRLAAVTTMQAVFAYVYLHIAISPDTPSLSWWEINTLESYIVFWTRLSVRAFVQGSSTFTLSRHPSRQLLSSNSLRPRYIRARYTIPPIEGVCCQCCT